MMVQSFGAGDLVRFQAYTQQAAEVDHVIGMVVATHQDIPLVGEWVDIAFGEVIRRGVPTGRLEIVRRASKDAHGDRYIEDHEAADRARNWPA
ncbi:hypothetical protein AAE026_07560 [Bradyrhizobium sp. DN5]|uniref:GDP-mannose 4,6-dehydratase n=1 Tax=unclassified Bradyrhizobium TaxID=2631580 RepID=UPI00115F92AD|nr:GDP-mannose 4,6-dehydratase [Bradyrhizobium sp. Rc2d]